MNYQYKYESPCAATIEMDCMSVLCESDGQGGTFTEVDWEQEIMSALSL